TVAPSATVVPSATAVPSTTLNPTQRSPTLAPSVALDYRESITVAIQSLFEADPEARRLQEEEWTHNGRALAGVPSDEKEEFDEVMRGICAKALGVETEDVVDISTDFNHPPPSEGTAAWRRLQVDQSPGGSLTPLTKCKVVFPEAGGTTGAQRAATAVDSFLLEDNLSLLVSENSFGPVNAVVSSIAFSQWEEEGGSCAGDPAGNVVSVFPLGPGMTVAEVGARGQDSLLSRLWFVAFIVTILALLVCCWLIAGVCHPSKSTKNVEAILFEKHLGSKEKGVERPRTPNAVPNPMMDLNPWNDKEDSVEMSHEGSSLSTLRRLIGLSPSRTHSGRSAAVFARPSPPKPPSPPTGTRDAKGRGGGSVKDEGCTSETSGKGGLATVVVEEDHLPGEEDQREELAPGWEAFDGMSGSPKFAMTTINPMSSNTSGSDMKQAAFTGRTVGNVLSRPQKEITRLKELLAKPDNKVSPIETNTTSVSPESIPIAASLSSVSSSTTREAPWTTSARAAELDTAVHRPQDASIAIDAPPRFFGSSHRDSAALSSVSDQESPLSPGLAAASPPMTLVHGEGMRPAGTGTAARGLGKVPESPAKVAKPMEEDPVELPRVASPRGLVVDINGASDSSGHGGHGHGPRSSPPRRSSARAGGSGGGKRNMFAMVPGTRGKGSAFVRQSQSEGGSSSLPPLPQRAVATGTGVGTLPKKAAPQGFSPRGSSPQGSSPKGSSPQGSSPQGSSPQGSSPQGSSPQGSSPQGSSPQGFSPQQKGAAAAMGGRGVVIPPKQRFVFPAAVPLAGSRKASSLPPDNDHQAGAEGCVGPLDLGAMGFACLDAQHSPSFQRNRTPSPRAFSGARGSPRSRTPAGRRPFGSGDVGAGGLPYPVGERHGTGKEVEATMGKGAETEGVEGEVAAGDLPPIVVGGMASERAGPLKATSSFRVSMTMQSPEPGQHLTGPETPGFSPSVRSNVPVDRPSKALPSPPKAKNVEEAFPRDEVPPTPSRRPSQASLQAPAEER
ncbi:unnamed protein product, partial [Discosporangium mesarthrocarpum]